MKQTVDSYGVTIGEHTSQITAVRNDLDNLDISTRNLAVMKTVGKYMGGNTNTGTLTNIKIEDYKISTTGNPYDLIGFVVSNITSKSISISGFTDLEKVIVYYKFKNDAGDVGSQLNRVINTRHSLIDLIGW